MPHPSHNQARIVNKESLALVRRRSAPALAQPAEPVAKEAALQAQQRVRARRGRRPGRRQKRLVVREALLRRRCGSAPRCLQQLCSRQLPGSLVAIQFVATYFVGTCLLNRASMPGEASPGAKKASCCGARLQQAHDLSALCHEHAVDLQRRQQPRWHLPRQSRPHRTSELQAMRPPEQRIG